MSFSLGIDTATNYLALALWDDDGMVGQQSSQVARAHASLILLHIEQLLEQHQCDKTALSSIGVGIGPGSYTGLRVGVSTAKGLARALAIPLYGVGSLSALAYPLREKQQKILVGMDARRGNFYATCYHYEQQKLQPLAEIEKAPQAVLKQRYQTTLEHGHAPDASYIAQQAHHYQQMGQASEPLGLIYL